MNIQTDFHMHTELSIDARTTLADNIARAIDLGLTEIAVTDHVDFNPNDDGAFRFNADVAFAATQAARQRFGDRITIRHGMELSEPHLYPQLVAPLMTQPLDVVIGSMHYVGPYGVHSTLFDVMTPDDALPKYFAETLALAEASDCDILGHLDYFDRYTTQRNLPPYDPIKYRAMILPILETIIRRNIALEVNASGLRLDPNKPFPHPTVLNWYKQLGGTLLSLGSDTHLPEHVGSGLDRCAEILVSLGFHEYHTFTERKAVPRPLVR